MTKIQDMNNYQTFESRLKQIDRINIYRFECAQLSLHLDGAAKNSPDNEHIKNAQDHLRELTALLDQELMYVEWGVKPDAPATFTWVDNTTF
ncbi:MAG TPA: hypothetical protein VIG24_01335 [Acidimicrobiia bacterium]